MQQDLGCGRVWDVAGFGMCQDLGCIRVWDAAGFWMRKGLPHPSSAACESERDGRGVHAAAGSKERAGLFLPSYLLTTAHLTESIFQARE